ncbi:magnesium transporter [Lutibacter agarilyticus]|uniref:Magnesium transport protein CorA n=1 Tax=Lutibacter agarilyticus TaxID=1109740 RepID=A0A238VS61_9FLAO|nr:magnesium/cobalt transporter CorA [Lutibacter agarilyticus]SNR37172.1 magnesium transporter [Lutibacter agarilyticus]
MKKKRLNRKKNNPLKFVFTGTQFEKEISLQLFEYSEDSFMELSHLKATDFNNFATKNKQYWLNTHGIHDVEVIENLCKKIGIHNLTIQDILDVNQRPKFQEYENYWFFSLQSILPSETNEINSEQISFILGKNFLVSFQERKADYFTHIRHRLREKTGILHERSVDYLLYLLIEAILDNYFKTIDTIETNTEKFGIIDINEDPSPAILKEIEVYKTQLNHLKKNVNPIKEFITKIEREEFALIDKRHIKYFFELKDLCLTIIDNCEKIENSLSSSIELFFSVQGHRMNQVMKTLTVVSSIFIPLTFIAGIYGMNFVNMPELHFKWGYHIVWAVIIVIFGAMIAYFKRKNWF